MKQLHFTAHHLLAITDKSGSFELGVIDWQTKEYIGKIKLTVSDPKVLQPKDCLMLYEYNPLPALCKELKEMWILQNYTLKK